MDSIVNELLDRWIQRLRLNHWEVVWEWKKDMDGGVGSMHPLYGQYRGELSLSPDIFSFRQMRITVIHELLHLAITSTVQSVERLDDHIIMPALAFATFFGQFQIQMERDVDALSKVFENCPQWHDRDLKKKWPK